jgi:hypothetical protein
MCWRAFACRLAELVLGAAIRFGTEAYGFVREVPWSEPSEKAGETLGASAIVLLN